MNVKAIIPTLPEIGREAIIVLAGALLATIVVRQLPDSVKAYFTLPTYNQK